MWVILRQKTATSRHEHVITFPRGINNSGHKIFLNNIITRNLINSVDASIREIKDIKTIALSINYNYEIT